MPSNELIHSSRRLYAFLWRSSSLPACSSRRRFHASRAQHSPENDGPSSSPSSSSSSSSPPSDRATQNNEDSNASRSAFQVRRVLLETVDPRRQVRPQHADGLEGVSVLPDHPLRLREFPSIYEQGEQDAGIVSKPETSPAVSKQEDSQDADNLANEALGVTEDEVTAVFSPMPSSSDDQEGATDEGHAADEGQATDKPKLSMRQILQTKRLKEMKQRKKEKRMQKQGTVIGDIEWERDGQDRSGTYAAGTDDGASVEGDVPVRKIAADYKASFTSGTIIFPRRSLQRRQFIPELSRKLRPLPTTLSRDPKKQKKVLVLFTPAFASSLVNEAGDLQDALPKLLMERLYAPHLHIDSVGDFRVGVAVVDKLPVPQGANKAELDGGEGMAYALVDKLSFVDVPKGGRTNEDTKPILNLELEMQGTRRRKRDLPSLKNYEIQIPLANTVFQSGQESILQVWGFKNKSLMYEDNLENLVVKPAGRAVASMTAIVKLIKKFPGDSFTTIATDIFTPLRPLTEPRAVNASMGNIIRQLRRQKMDGEEEEVIRASEELEEAVNGLVAKASLPEGPVAVWALIVKKETRDWLASRGTKFPSLAEHGVLGKPLSSLDANSSDPSTNPTSEEPPVRPYPNLTAILRGGGRLHRVMSGGGGWGKKAGLLSIDPAVEFVPGSSENTGSPNWMSPEIKDMGEALGSPVEPDDYIQFFLSAPDANEIQKGTHPPGPLGFIRDNHLDTIEVGVIPSSVDAMPETSSSPAKNERRPAQPELFPGVFGLLSEKGFAISREDTKGQPASTMIDVPYAQLAIRRRLPGQNSELTGLQRLEMRMPPKKKLDKRVPPRLKKDYTLMAAATKKDDKVAESTPEKDDKVVGSKPEKDDKVIAATPKKDKKVASTPKKDNKVVASTPKKDNKSVATTLRKEDEVVASTRKHDDQAVASTVQEESPLDKVPIRKHPTRESSLPTSSAKAKRVLIRKLFFGRLDDPISDGGPGSLATIEMGAFKINKEAGVITRPPRAYPDLLETRSPDGFKITKVPGVPTLRPSAASSQNSDVSDREIAQFTSDVKCTALVGWTPTTSVQEVENPATLIRKVETTIRNPVPKLYFHIRSTEDPNSARRYRNAVRRENELKAAVQKRNDTLDEVDHMTRDTGKPGAIVRDVKQPAQAKQKERALTEEQQKYTDQLAALNDEDFTQEKRDLESALKEAKFARREATAAIRKSELPLSKEENTLAVEGVQESDDALESLRPNILKIKDLSFNQLSRRFLNLRVALKDRTEEARKLDQSSEFDPVTFWKVYGFPIFLVKLLTAYHRLTPEIPDSALATYDKGLQDMAKLPFGQLRDAARKLSRKKAAQFWTKWRLLRRIKSTTTRYVRKEFTARVVANAEAERSREQELIERQQKDKLWKKMVKADQLDFSSLELLFHTLKKSMAAPVQLKHQVWLSEGLRASIRFSLWKRPATRDAIRAILQWLARANHQPGDALGAHLLEIIAWNSSLTRMSGFYPLSNAEPKLLVKYDAGDAKDVMPRDNTVQLSAQSRNHANTPPNDANMTFAEKHPWEYLYRFLTFWPLGEIPPRIDIKRNQENEWHPSLPMNKIRVRLGIIFQKFDDAINAHSGQPGLVEVDIGKEIREQFVGLLRAESEVKAEITKLGAELAKHEPMMRKITKRKIESGKEARQPDQTLPRKTRRGRRHSKKALRITRVISTSKRIIRPVSIPEPSPSTLWRSFQFRQGLSNRFKSKWRTNPNSFAFDLMEKRMRHRVHERIKARIAAKNALATESEGRKADLLNPLEYEEPDLDYDVVERAIERRLASLGIRQPTIKRLKVSEPGSQHVQWNEVEEQSSSTFAPLVPEETSEAVESVDDLLQYAQPSTFAADSSDFLDVRSPIAAHKQSTTAQKHLGTWEEPSGDVLWSAGGDVENAERSSTPPLSKESSGKEDESRTDENESWAEDDDDDNELARIKNRRKRNQPSSTPELSETMAAREQPRPEEAKTDGEGEDEQNEKEKLRKSILALLGKL